MASSGQDEYYSYDNLNQLTVLKRGDLNAGRTDISGTPVWQENFTFDPTGNWHGSSSGYVTRTSGVIDLDQNRSNNPVNEITGFTTTTGTGWATPAYNAAGNMTTMPQPASLSNGYTAQYDAWNRMVELKNGTTTVATYRYDGATRRVTKLVGSNTTHFYYSDQWQILEERLNTGSSADRQFVWGQRYVDDLVLRDQSTTRHYVLNDLVNVTSIINTSGTVQERYGYNAFGTSRVMNASFVVQSSSSYNWETRFAAYRWDSESGLYQVRYRYYHPLLGTWINRDPIGERGGLNLYSFVGNNPIVRFDPLGLTYNGVPIWPLIVPPSVPYYFKPKPQQYPQGFSLCQRDLQKDGNFDFPTMIGNALGGEHSYLQHVDSEGNKWGWGFGTGGTASEKHFDPNSCKPCKKTGSLKFGSGAGKPADTATDAEIQDCIKINPPTKPYSKFKYNCKDWGKEAAKNCGLDCN